MRNDQRVKRLLGLVDSMRDAASDSGVEVGDDEVRIGDSRDGRFYQHDDKIRLALKVALITGRPLLLVGPPGCGKSSLAPYVARNLDLEYDYYTVTESAQASDILWEVDYLERLNDANLRDRTVKDLEHYVKKGKLWQAFERKGRGSLLLIDEIDKADASFANSLLVALGSLEFDVAPLKNKCVKASGDEVILVIITSNEERELPLALTRRCITHRVRHPTANELVSITESRWKPWMADKEFRRAVAGLAESLTDEDRQEQGARVSTAEFLDLVQVLKVNGTPPGDATWQMVESLVLSRAAPGSPRQ